MTLLEKTENKMVKTEFPNAAGSKKTVGAKIAILSGKGGTGKTFLSVNLAAVLKNVVYLDCDVEEPNGSLFFKPEIKETKNVFVKVPKVKRELCTGCKKCVEFCAYNALAYTDKLLIFDEVCHNCGGCSLVCERKAFYETDKKIGHIEYGLSDFGETHCGIMDIGNRSGVPIIKALFEELKGGGKTVISDCPPGSACLAAECIKNSDYCVMVTEPTLFGLSDLKKAVSLVKALKKPFGVIINRYNGNKSFVKLCQKEGYDIIAIIAFEKKLAKICAEGEIAALKDVRYFEMFKALSVKIAEAAR